MYLLGGTNEKTARRRLNLGGIVKTYLFSVPNKKYQINTYSPGPDRTRTRESIARGLTRCATTLFLTICNVHCAVALPRGQPFAKTPALLSCLVSCRHIAISATLRLKNRPSAGEKTLRDKSISKKMFCKKIFFRCLFFLKKIKNFRYLKK